MRTSWASVNGAAIRVVVFAALGVAARSQISCDLPQPPPLGEWTTQVDFDALATPPLPPEIGEFFMAVVLPPPIDETSLSQSARLSLDRVLLAVRPGCLYLPGSYESTTWIWNPVVPRRLEDLPMHGTGLPAPANLAGDPFCAGATHFADGDPILAGGVDFPEKCVTSGSCVVDPSGNPELNIPVGHKYAYRLDISQDPPRWLGPADGWPKENVTEHYYPTLITRENGNPEVIGHTASPSSTCPEPYGSAPSAYPYSAAIGEMCEEFDSPTGSFIQRMNRLHPTATCSTAIDPLFNTRDYPRVHVTGSGFLVLTNSGFLTPPPPPLVLIPSAKYLDLKATCPPSDWRWRRQSGAQADLDRDGGSSILLIHDSQVTGNREDVIYAIGGTSGLDDDVGADPSLVSASVQKIVGVNGPADNWVPVPSLPEPRANHNTVVLPNGKLIVIGGETDTGAGVLSAAMYEPPELYPGAGQSWITLPEQLADRGYHSSAFLLRDGRVVSVGGASTAAYSYHTLEIYAPEYYFSGIRPDIVNWPKPTQETVAYEDPLVLDDEEFEVEAYVHFCPPVQPIVKRVVLVRPGSPTHAFDSSQRYVELRFDPEDQQTPNNKLIRVTKPSDFEAPPGYYMLFVVDGRDRPSVGQWIRFDH